MFNTKGSSGASVGYSCYQQTLVAGWRRVWSQTPGTTDPNAPFGIVTLASSGSEGGPHMGAMRQAQTAGYGVLPGPNGSVMENTFVAQAYDLDDPWGPGIGPCYDGWETGSHGRTDHTGWHCCPIKGCAVNTTKCTPALAKRCEPACASLRNTPSHGGIHPRSKKQVGYRLGTAAYNTVYGGRKAFTGPTLAGCQTDGKSLTIEFDAPLLRGDTVVVREFPPVMRTGGGSQLYVQTNASLFCMEPQPVLNKTNGAVIPGAEYCPTWAGGDGKTVHYHDPRAPPTPRLDSGWVLVNYSLSGISLEVDLAPLNGSAPTAVRYAWGILDCNDYSDPNLYISHGSNANCPIMSSSQLPANPFMAKITNGKCECIPPQTCG